MTTQTKSASFPIAVLGGGLVGKMAALYLASRWQQGDAAIALVSPKSAARDPRTTAMLMPAISMLEELGCWEAIKPHTAALKTMRLIDGSTRLFRAPVTDFRATEIELEAFGHNVPNHQMLELLDAAIQSNPNITMIEASADAVTQGAESVQLHLNTGDSVSCRLLVAADGRHSIAREAAGISARKWAYPQTAIVLNFAHSLPHGGVSAEFHTETGPFTQVPLPPTAAAPQRSSLVWMVKPEQAEQLRAKPLDELSSLIETKLQSSYGKVTVENQPAAIPMEGLIANGFGSGRTVLLGEAGHVFPPIGAQGFNLGMRDLRDLLQSLQNSSGETDPGAATVVNAYARARAADVTARTAGVDLMNRSLLTDFLPVQIARTAGMSLLGGSSFLRKLAMYQGLGVGGQTGALLSGPGKDLLARFRSRSDKAAPSP